MKASVSGNPPADKFVLPTQKENFPPGVCGMPKAAQSVLGENNSTIGVTKGGFRFKNDQWYYVSPCKNCKGVMDLNPSLEHSPLPPGVPKNMPPNTEIPFKAPKSWEE